jgi:hypothetical protein
LALNKKCPREVLPSAGRTRTKNSRLFSLMDALR